MSQTFIANSTVAGIVSYPVVAALLTAILSITGVVIPPFGIGALVVTQTIDISIASTLLSYVITHFTSDSIQQQIAELAKLAPKILALKPVVDSSPQAYPYNPPIPTPSNLANAAITVIQAHTERSGDLAEKNGA